LKKNQKDAKRGVQHATNTANKNLIINLEEKIILLILVAFMDISFFLWVEEFGQLRQMSVF
jgi:hypothetical protein